MKFRIIASLIVIAAIIAVLFVRNSMDNAAPSFNIPSDGASTPAGKQFNF